MLKHRDEWTEFRDERHKQSVAHKQMTISHLPKAPCRQEGARNIQ